MRNYNNTPTIQIYLVASSRVFPLPAVAQLQGFALPLHVEAGGGGAGPPSDLTGAVGTLGLTEFFPCFRCAFA